MPKLIVSIPEISRSLLEMYFNEDLIGAELIDFVPVIEDDGRILLGEIILHMKDGRMVAIVPVMRGWSHGLNLRFLMSNKFSSLFCF